MDDDQSIDDDQSKDVRTKASARERLAFMIGMYGSYLYSRDDKIKKSANDTANSGNLYKPSVLKTGNLAKTKTRKRPNKGHNANNPSSGISYDVTEKEQVKMDKNDGITLNLGTPTFHDKTLNLMAEVNSACGCAKTCPMTSYSTNDVDTTTERVMICGPCCDPSKINQSNGSIPGNKSDLDTDLSDVSPSLTDNLNSSKPADSVYYFRDENSINWYAAIDPLLLQRRSQFSCGLLKWYKSPMKARQPDGFHYRILNGLAVYKCGVLDLHIRKYGNKVSRDIATHVAKQVNADHVPSTCRYKMHRVQRRTKVSNGILKFPDAVGGSTVRRTGEVTFTTKKRVRRKSRPSHTAVPVINGHMRKRIRHAIMRMAKVDPRSGKLCVDSGATTHLVKSNKWLGTLLNRHKIMIKDAVGKSHESSAVGQLNMIVKNKNGAYHKLSNMGNAGKIDALMMNLLSVSQLCDQGYSVIFKPDKAELHTPDKVVVPLHRQGGLYFIEGEHAEGVTETKYTRSQKDKAVENARKQRERDFAFLGSTVETVKKMGDMAEHSVPHNHPMTELDKELQKSGLSRKSQLKSEFNEPSTGYRKPAAMRYWKNTKSAVHARNAAHMWHLVHRRMGHPSRAVTDGLVRSGKFGYIPMCDERDKFCECCSRAAFYRPANTRQTHVKTSLRGSKWHVDLAGPFEPDRHGHRYAMNMVDDCSGMFWGTTLRTKKGAARGFIEFLDWLKQQKSLAHKPIHDIICLQSDRGGEFTSGPEDTGKKRSLFDKLCKSLNISRRLTSAKSPNQNGRAERANRTLFNTMRCNLMDSGLGWKHWGDAYKAAIIARNYAPKEGGKLSRFERFYGYGPSYKRLMPFGATGFLEHKTDKKAITRSRIGRMIGYPTDTKGWTFLREDGTIEVTAHARFDTRNYMERAIAKGQSDPAELGFTLTNGTNGLPLGGTDADIRELVRKYETDIIKCSEPKQSLNDDIQNQHLSKRKLNRNTEKVTKLSSEIARKSS